MAFATIHFKGPNGIVKDAPVGFSWTTFFTFLFVPWCSGDWTWPIFILIASPITFGLAGILFAFIYNRIYIEGLLKQGYAVISYWGDKREIESSAQIKLGNSSSENTVSKII